MADRTGMAEKASWADVFRGGRALPAVLINVGVALHAVSIFITSTTMPSIVEDLGGVALYAWPSMLYMLGTIVGAAMGAPFRGWLGGRNGFIASALLLGAGAAGSATAPTIEMLLASHLVQGFGGGLLISQSMSLIGVLFPGPLRTRILSIVSSTWGIVSLIGPPIGGQFSEIGWWRGAFWIWVPVAVVVAFAAWRAIPASSEARTTTRVPIVRLTLLACAVLSVGISGQIHMLATQIVLVGLAVALVWIVIRRDGSAQSPLFPSNVFSLRSTVGAAYLASFAMSIAYTPIQIFLPLILQSLHDASHAESGYFLVIYSLAWTIGALIVAGWHGRGAIAAMVGGGAIMTGSLAAYAVGFADFPLTVLAVILVFAGLGIGSFNVHLTSWTMSAAAPGEEAITASAMPAIRSLGLAFGAAGAGLLANAGGLAEGVSPERVESALYLVYGAFLIAPVAMMLFLARTLRLQGREAAVTAA